MRAVLVASLFSAVAGQSGATVTALTNAVTACGQANQAALQPCVTESSTLSLALTNSSALNFAPFCTSTCFPVLRAYYASFGACVVAYRPTLLAALEADGVANATLMADTLTNGYMQLPRFMDFFCLKNERGDYCYSMFTQLSLSLATTTNNGSSVLDAVCGSYYNMGCCLPSLGSLIPSVSFMSSIASICPVLANYTPPVCPGWGQSAVALTVSMSLNGLTCSAYATQSETFKAQYMAALKLDLAAQGINAEYITISSITDVSGVCTLKVTLRAASDAATNALSTTAASLNTATLTNSNGVLATGSGVGSVTALGSAAVTTTTFVGPTATNSNPTQQNSNSGAILAPCAALLAAVLVWLA